MFIRFLFFLLIASRAFILDISKRNLIFHFWVDRSFQQRGKEERGKTLVSILFICQKDEEEEGEGAGEGERSHKLQIMPAQRQRKDDKKQQRKQQKTTTTKAAITKQKKHKLNAGKKIV